MVLRRDTGMTLLEVLIGSVILVLIAIPVGGLFFTSQRGIEVADRSREARFVLDGIIERVEAADLVLLWKNFGWGFKGEGGEAARCPESASAIRSGLTNGTDNPLFVSPAVLDRIKQNNWKVTLKYRFLTCQEIDQPDPHRAKSNSGLLHLQAGVFWLNLWGAGVDEEVRRVIYCPMILGRPGLQLSQCPAMNPALRDGAGIFANYP